ncbi:MAG: MBL fold metallo-hydrolase [Fidelibacterota bacterium]|nr:MAG: MBL fold metallo-hydrolase [Candidatus Neomarinimicrobiota bacterium]
MYKKPLSLHLLVCLFLGLYCSKSEDFIIHHQVSGPGETNSYLLYTVKSKKAALFDVGGRIDTLVSIINDENLDLKYIFITHAHPDHVYGIAAIMEKYPKAKIGISGEEYEDTDLYARWEEALDSALVAAVKESPPEILDMMNFDFEALGEPGITLEDDQILKLGDLRIRTFLSPGHSRGSICFYVGDALFSGDVLFYRQVGRTDLPQSGGPEEIVKSVHRLYSSLSDKTKVYPGHGLFTDIGTEKLENEEVRVESVSLQN